MTFKKHLFGLAVAGVLIIGSAAVAEAKSHSHVGPQAKDAGQASSVPATDSPQPCFLEPDGFRSQIRWDADCAAKRAKDRHEHAGGNTPAKFEAPRGFHSQIRWD